MLTISVRIDGMSQTQAMLSRVKKALTNMEPALTAAGKYLQHVFSVEAFESEGGIYGRRWAPLNPVYTLWKSTRYPGRGVLERTGNLRRNFRLSTGATFAQISNPTPYGPFHQRGGKLPQRVIVALEKRQRDEVERIICTDLLQQIRRAL